MDGPTFLLLYTGLVIVAIFATRWFNRGRDPRASEPLPPVPSPADPYELAWLRGGAPEAIRLAVYDLKMAGLLTVAHPSGGGPTSSVLVAALDAGRSTAVAPIGRLVLRACMSPQNPKALMRGDVVERVDEACLHWHTKYTDEGLLVPTSARVQGWLVVVVVMGMLAGITVVRVVNSLAAGHTNIAFLIVLTLVTMVLLPAFSHPTGRLTLRGRRHLAQLRNALAPDPSMAPRTARTAAAAPDSGGCGGAMPAGGSSSSSSDGPWSPATAAALVPLSLYGMGALPPVERTEMGLMFEQAAKADASGGGGGCGSASSCGSSDSGGGGDGGGGGCGGGGD